LLWFCKEIEPYVFGGCILEEEDDNVDLTIVQKIEERERCSADGRSR